MPKKTKPDSIKRRTAKKTKPDFIKAYYESQGEEKGFRYKPPVLGVDRDVHKYKGQSVPVQIIDHRHDANKTLICGIVWDDGHKGWAKANDLCRYKLLIFNW